MDPLKSSNPDKEPPAEKLTTDVDTAVDTSADISTPSAPSTLVRPPQIVSDQYFQDVEDEGVDNAGAGEFGELDELDEFVIDSDNPSALTLDQTDAEADTYTSVNPLSEFEDKLEATILDLGVFKEGDSVIVQSFDSKNKYHNQILDFLYIEQNVILLLDSQTDDILELTIIDNKIDTNENKIYTITKIIETEQQHTDIVIKKNLENIEIIESGIEIQERLLSVWERKWSDNEYINSIIENLKKIYKKKSYYDLDIISKNLFELIQDHSLQTDFTYNDLLTEEDNIHLIKDIMNHTYTHNFIKPIILDKRKIYSNQDNQKIFDSSDQSTLSRYTHKNDITIIDNKTDIQAEDSIHKRYLLHRDNITFSSHELALQADTYENELVNGEGETVNLSNDEYIPVKRIGGHLRPMISPDLEKLPYTHIMKAFVNEPINFEHTNFEYFMMKHGLDYNTKVYRPNVLHSSFKIYNFEDMFTVSNKIETRIADSSYYRYRDIVDTRRITDSFGRVKSSQICHGIKGEYMYSGSFNRKEHKDSFFNKSITKLPVKHKYIEGETLLICGFVLHNVNLHFPNFIEKKHHIDDLFRLHYKTYDDGYTLYDYVLHNEYTTRTISNLYDKVYDVNTNQATYKDILTENINYSKNNFIYFNSNKKYTLSLTSDDMNYDVKVKGDRLEIIDRSTNKVTTTDINDTTIPQNIIDSLIVNKILYIDEKGTKRLLHNKLRERQYIDSIRQMIPSIQSIFNYEINQTHGKHILEHSYNIKDINRILVKYKLTYNELPNKYRQQLKQIVAKNILSYTQITSVHARIKEQEKHYNKVIQKIYRTLDYYVSRLGLIKTDESKYITYYQYFIQSLGTTDNEHK